MTQSHEFGVEPSPNDDVEIQTQNDVIDRNSNKESETKKMTYKEVAIKYWNLIKVEVASFVACFIGISIVAFIHFRTANSIYAAQSEALPNNQLENSLQSPPPIILISFGAASILIYGAVEAPLAQPRNALFGQIISAFVGVTIKQIFYSGSPSHNDNDLLWLQSSLSVSLALFAMQVTKTVHPPGGATALYAVVGGQVINTH